VSPSKSAPVAELVKVNRRDSGLLRDPPATLALVRGTTERSVTLFEVVYPVCSNNHPESTSVRTPKVIFVPLEGFNARCERMENELTAPPSSSQKAPASAITRSDMLDVVVIGLQYEKPSSNETVGLSGLPVKMG
jgi:hypothetical protein